MIVLLNDRKLCVTGLDQILDNLGFLEAQREVYLFIDKGVYEMTGNVKTGKAMVLNYSISSTQKQTFDNPQFRNSYSKLFMMNLYTFDIVINSGIKQFNDIEFHLLNGYTNSICNIYGSRLDNDFKTYTNGYSYYSSKIQNSEDRINDFFIDQESSNSPIPLPYYYTKTHEDVVEGDSALLNTNYFNPTFNGSKLKDRHSKIRVFDINSWYNKFNSSVEALQNMNMMLDDVPDEYEIEYDTNVVDVSLVSDHLLNSTISSQFGGFCYGYDSSKAEKVQCVYHPSSVSIPLPKHQSKNRVANQIDLIKNKFENTCKTIEKDYGNIHVMFSPNKIGDKTEIVFRDYLFDNQPVVSNGTMINRDESMDVNINKTAFDIMSCFE